jgi:hypothetical protein
MSLKNDLNIVKKKESIKKSLNDSSNLSSLIDLDEEIPFSKSTPIGKNIDSEDFSESDNSILIAKEKGKPVSLEINEGEIVGRQEGEDIKSLTKAQVQNLINVQDGADKTINHKLSNDYFPIRMSVIRNEEMNNLLSTIEGTEITVDSINTGVNPEDNYIKLSWLPYIDSLFDPDTDEEWALLNLEKNTVLTNPSLSGDYTHILKITGLKGSFSGKTLYFEETSYGAASTWSSGDKVSLYNPFKNGWDWPQRSPVISNSSTATSWRYKYVAPCGGFQRSDGKFVILVDGQDQYNRMQIGAFESSNLIDWTVLNSDNPIFSYTDIEGDWNGWHISGYGSVNKLDSEDRYIFYVSGYPKTSGAAGAPEIRWIKFDENFSSESIEYSSSQIVTDATIGLAGIRSANVIKYGSVYRMMYVDRGDNASTSVDAYTVKEAFSDTPEGPFVYTGSTISILDGIQTNNGIFCSSHCDAFKYIMYNSRLYCLVGGTSRYLESGTRANRVYGLMYWDERKDSPEWVLDHKSPVFINPLGGDLWSTDYSWCKDHIGGYPTIIYNKDDGKLYFFYSANQSSDTYKVALLTLDIQKID